MQRTLFLNSMKIAHSFYHVNRNEYSFTVCFISPVDRSSRSYSIITKYRKGGKYDWDITYWPRDVCRRSVTNVEVPGQVQLLARSAYLNSSSQTTCSANLTWSLFSGRKICTYWGTFGAKSFTAHERRIVCSSCETEQSKFERIWRLEAQWHKLNTKLHR